MCIFSTNFVIGFFPFFSCLCYPKTKGENQNQNQNLVLMEVSGDEGGGGGGEVLEVIKCESCGFTEECTSTYISRIRERYCGLWICGLCIEVVKDEILRSSNSSDQQRSKNNNNIISTEEALKKHINVCKSFQSATASSQQHPIFAMGKLLRKSLDSPRSLRSSAANPPSPLHEVNPPSFVH